jgi:hypothetical protein
MIMGWKNAIQLVRSNRNQKTTQYADLLSTDLPKKRQFARDYLPCVFQGREVRKILKLDDGSDVSQVMFDRRSFEARTNPVYVEIEDTSPKATSTRFETV